MLRRILIVAVMMCVAAIAESQSLVPPHDPAPSSAEVEAILVNAEHSIGRFKEEFKANKEVFSKPGFDFYEQDMKGCDDALFAVADIRKNGFNAYAGVALISVLDDLTVDGSRASAAVFRLALDETLAGRKNQVSLSASMLGIAEAANSCRESSTLLLHATLRQIATEEYLIAMVNAELAKEPEKN